MGWRTFQASAATDGAAGKREVKQGLQRTLLKDPLHQDLELFDKAYGYIKQY